VSLKRPALVELAVSLLENAAMAAAGWRALCDNSVYQVLTGGRSHTEEAQRGGSDTVLRRTHRGNDAV
jgi:hypothetical protein